VDKITDKVLIKKLLDSAVDKTLVDKIDEIKSKIDAVSTEAELITLQNEIFGTSVPTETVNNESTTEKPTTNSVVPETLVVASFIEVDGKKYVFPFKEKEKLTSSF
jgi:hypothetical protein